jgi:hypothetical protein
MVDTAKHYFFSMTKVYKLEVFGQPIFLDLRVFLLDILALFHFLFPMSYEKDQEKP